MITSTAFVLAACAAAMGAPASLSGSGNAVNAGVPHRTLDERLNSASEEEAGFAGAYLNEDGSLVVLHAGEGMGEREVKAFRRHFPEHARKPVGQIRHVRHGYSALSAWRRAAEGAFSLDGGPAGGTGILFTDIDERGNRLVVGVPDFGSAAAVRERAAASGIPDDAISISVEEPFIPFKTLQSWMGKAPWAYGGICGGAQVTGAIVCSAGPGGYLNDSFGYFVASHCTAVWGGLDVTPFYQPSKMTRACTDYYNAGMEIADPAYVASSACPAGLLCRYSDAAWISGYGTGCMTGGRVCSGSIYQTTGINSITISDRDLPSLTLDGFRGHALLGETLHKVGRTTGISYGTVTGTCVNVREAWQDGTASNRMLLCQDVVTAPPGIGAGAKGDSGAPVYSMGTGSATLIGVLWGGQLSANNFMFSNMDGIQREMGVFRLR